MPLPNLAIFEMLSQKNRDVYHQVLKAFQEGNGEPLPCWDKVDVTLRDDDSFQGIVILGISSLYDNEILSRLKKQTCRLFIIEPRTHYWLFCDPLISFFNQERVIILTYNQGHIGPQKYLSWLSHNNYVIIDSCLQYDDDVRGAFEKQLAYAQYNEMCDIAWNQRFFHNFYRNLSLLPKVFDASCAFQQLRHQPAFVIGAGTSLDLVDEELKKAQESGVLIACGSAWNLLHKKGIVPDFAVSLDTSLNNARKIRELPPYQVPLMFRLRACPQGLEDYCGPRFLIKGRGWTLFEEKIEELMGCYQSGITDPGLSVDEGVSVSCLGLELAIALGLSPIFLVGIDLCYHKDQEYPDEMLNQQEKLFKQQQSSIPWNASCDLHNQDGERVTTKWHWMIERDYLSQICGRQTTSQIMRVPSYGLPLEGVPQISWKSIFDRYLFKKIDKANLIHTILQRPTFSIDSHQVVTQISFLEESLNILEKGLNQILNDYETMTSKAKIDYEWWVLEENMIFRYLMKDLQERYLDVIDPFCEDRTTSQIESIFYLLEQIDVHRHYIQELTQSQSS